MLNKQYITTYIVKSGDTLYCIAKKFNKTEKDLLEHNNLKSNKELYKGYVIRFN
ncbi:LysM domain-containing protein [Terrisporobacter petrolearius]|uniref:LysM peptidoglycan-binding domain-containing protein n=1 Tax=Terrisporobacter petrolearius TaxID=1460447 RepID=UPI0031CC3C05